MTNADIFEKTTVFRTSYHKLEDLIETVFIEHFDLVVDQELRNNTMWTVSIDGHMSKEDIEIVVYFLDGDKKERSARALMQCLCAWGIIEPGEYFIDASW